MDITDYAGGSIDITGHTSSNINVNGHTGSNTGMPDLGMMTDGRRQSGSREKATASVVTESFSWSLSCSTCNM